MISKYRTKIIIFLIILIGLIFRFNNINWDENYHLHPDERFLTMVAGAMTTPKTFNQYFNQKTSLFNPTNIGYNFYVYGTFPLTLVKIMAQQLKLDNYNGITILGRSISASLDLLVVYFVYGISKAVFRKNRRIAIFAALFYAISVLPIQLSHFFTVDTFLNFFMVGSAYFILKKRKIVSAIFFGLALACKITAVYISPLLLTIVMIDNFEKRYKTKYKFISNLIFDFIVFFLAGYLTLRIADPYFFQNSSFFDPRISESYLQNLKTLKGLLVINDSNWYPPMVQWISKNSIYHSLVNNSIFGFGVVNSILLIIGFLFFFFSFIKRNLSRSLIKVIKGVVGDPELKIFIFAFWTISFFVFEMLQTTPTLRYFYIIYPYLAIFAAIGLDSLVGFIKTYCRSGSRRAIIYGIIFISLFIWPLMFSSIYFLRNSRVVASEWIFANLPNGAMILSEAWDDGLPFSLSDGKKTFVAEQLPIFDPDTKEKQEKMNGLFTIADYYILTSNRGWGSITTVPKKYPWMSSFYRKLLNGEDGRFEKVKEFTSYPSIKYLGIPLELPDQWADESFTVYDHPKVIIYKIK